MSQFENCKECGQPFMVHDITSLDQQRKEHVMSTYHAEGMLQMIMKDIEKRESQQIKLK